MSGKVATSAPIQTFSRFALLEEDSAESDEEKKAAEEKKDNAAKNAKKRARRKKKAAAEANEVSLLIYHVPLIFSCFQV